jgi:serine/threonine protein kinase
LLKAGTLVSAAAPNAEGRDAFRALVGEPGERFTAYRLKHKHTDSGHLGRIEDLLAELNGDAGGADAVDYKSLPPGTIIEDLYRVEGVIGEGGMATVYAAQNVETGERVAVKVLDPRTKDGFLRELLLAARVKHPNVVRVHDYGLMNDPETPYLVMDLLEGKTLLRECRRRPLGRHAAVELFDGILAALEVAHDKGVVHRDIKPSNLFLRGGTRMSERLVLLDFGIASHVDDDDDESFTGTPRYAPPEYLTRGQASPALDVYQVGLCLVEALTGVPVVEPLDPVGVMKVHLQGPLRVPSETLGDGLAEVIQRAIALDPEHRYGNAAEFRAALVALDEDARIFDDAPTLADEAPPPPTTADDRTLKGIALMSADDKALDLVKNALSVRGVEATCVAVTDALPDDLEVAATVVVERGGARATVRFKSGDTRVVEGRTTRELANGIVAALG